MKTAKKWNIRERTVLKLVTTNAVGAAKGQEGVTYSELAKATGFSHRTLQRAVTELERQHLVKKLYRSGVKEEARVLPGKRSASLVNGWATSPASGSGKRGRAPSSSSGAAASSRRKRPAKS